MTVLDSPSTYVIRSRGLSVGWYPDTRRETLTRVLTPGIPDTGEVLTVC